MPSRDDAHRPSQLDPESYRYLFSFSYPGMDSFDSFNMPLLAAVRTGQPQRAPVWKFDERTGTVVPGGYRTVTSPWGRLPFFRKSNDAGGCDSCGASYRHGDAYLHEPTGEVVMIGHICSEKMGLYPDRAEWEAARLESIRWSKDAKVIRERRRRVHAEIRKTLAAYPGLNRVLRGEHRILKDMRARLIRYGSLSVKQVAFARKLAAEAAEAKTTPAGEPVTEVTPPAGRATVEGEVLSLKEQDSPYGPTLKMLIQVGPPAARYRLWGSVPSDLRRAARTLAETERYATIEDKLRGRRVRFTATVKPKEQGFGFYERPTGGEVVVEEVTP